jgi:hypothetical protein
VLFARSGRWLCTRRVCSDFSFPYSYRERGCGGSETGERFGQGRFPISRSVWYASTKGWPYISGVIIMGNKAKVSKVSSKRVAAKKASTRTVSVWQDDPGSALAVISRPVPDLSKGVLKFRIKGPVVAPGVYPEGTAEFRYWTAAEALRRGGDFWAPFLSATQWQPGPILGVTLDKGVDLNAYYDRTELAFFHERLGGVTYYSGESPDVVCHEMGHACLDAHRPELFDAPFVEAGAFHESFGDMSAILTALQLPSVRAAALAGVKGCNPSDLSRCAEQLGAAIRIVNSTAVDSDCLRNACNDFKYVDPKTLPNNAPATALCAEAHSFSRVFTGAFYEILSGMLKILSKTPTQANLATVSTDFARLLMDAIAAAPVQPDYFAQVASHIVDADAARFSGKYRSALTAIFVKRQIIPASAIRAQAIHKAQSRTAVAARLSMVSRPQTQSQKVMLPAQEFGLGNQNLVVVAPFERKPFLSVAAGLADRQTGPGNVEQATHHFVRMLFARNRVDTESGTKKIAVTDNTSRDKLRKTHVLTKTEDGLKLTRRFFHCGCAITP